MVLHITTPERRHQSTNEPVEINFSKSSQINKADTGFQVPHRLCCGSEDSDLPTTILNMCSDILMGLNDNVFKQSAK